VFIILGKGTKLPKVLSKNKVTESQRRIRKLYNDLFTILVSRHYDMSKNSVSKQSRKAIHSYHGSTKISGRHTRRKTYENSIIPRRVNYYSIDVVTI